MERPVGVTILAVLCFIGAVLLVLLAGLLVLGFGIIGAAASPNTEGGGAMRVLLGLGAALGVVVLFFALLDLIIGIGLWRLKNWARVVTLVVAGLGALANVGGLLVSLLSFEPASLVSGLIGLGINGLIVWYLLQPDVKQAFGVS